MKLLVYMRDGRTVYRITGRGKLAKLLRTDVEGVEGWDKDQHVNVERGIWNPATGEYNWTANVRLRFIAKGSIGVIEEDRYSGDAA